MIELKTQVFHVLTEKSSRIKETMAMNEFHKNYKRGIYIK